MSSDRMDFDPADTSAVLVQRAAALSVVGRDADAIPLLLRAIALDPQNAETRCDLALSLLHTGRLAEADQEAFRAVALAPDYGRCYRVRSLILQAAKRGPGAVQLAREALRIESGSYQSHYVLGQAFLTNGEPKNALNFAVKAVELAPENSSGHDLVGRASLALKHWPQAEKAFRESLRLDPTEWTAMNNLGVALRAQGRHADAIQAFERAAQMSPSADQARRNLMQEALPLKSPGPDLIQMILIPWLLPIFLLKWLAEWLQARSVRKHLTTSGKEYYASQSASGAMARMTPRDFGIFWGFISLLGYCICALAVAIVVYSLHISVPPYVGLYLSFGLAVLLAIATGVFLGRRHAGPNP